MGETTTCTLKWEDGPGWTPQLDGAAGCVLRSGGPTISALKITSGQKESQVVFIDRAVLLAGIHNRVGLWALICNYFSLNEASGYVPN